MLDVENSCFTLNKYPASRLRLAFYLPALLLYDIT